MAAFDLASWSTQLADIIAVELRSLDARTDGRVLAIAVDCTPWHADVLSLSAATDADEPLSIEEWDLAAWRLHSFPRSDSGAWPRAAALSAAANAHYRVIESGARAAFRDDLCEACARALVRAAAGNWTCLLYAGHPDRPQQNFVGAARPA